MLNLIRRVDLSLLGSITFALAIISLYPLATLKSGGFTRYAPEGWLLFTVICWYVKPAPVAVLNNSLLWSILGHISIVITLASFGFRVTEYGILGTHIEAWLACAIGCYLLSEKLSKANEEMALKEP